MAEQKTLCIIKPDAVKSGHTGEILARIASEGLQILALRQLWLTRAQAEGFYAVHQGRPFFDDLCTFMSRGPVVVVALSGTDAVQRWRNLIGATDPKKAAQGTIRQKLGTDVGQNAVHGSDSEQTGREECAYFFAGMDLVGGLDLNQPDE